MSEGSTPFRRRLARRFPSRWLPETVTSRLGSTSDDPASRVEKPLERSIRWVPRGYVDHDTEQEFDLFVDQPVLRDVMAHLLSSGGDGPFGLLTGKLLASSSSGIPFVHVLRAHPAAKPFLESEDMAAFDEHVDEVTRRAESSDEEVLGWYHAHHLLGVTVTARDARLHMKHFHQPWHCALVLVPDGRPPLGGFFTRLRGDGSFRRSTVPFYEVVPTSKLSFRPAPSFVGWQNYESDRPVICLRPDQPGAARMDQTRRVEAQPQQEDAGDDAPRLQKEDARDDAPRPLKEDEMETDRLEVFELVPAREPRRLQDTAGATEPESGIAGPEEIPESDGAGDEPSAGAADGSEVFELVPATPPRPESRRPSGAVEAREEGAEATAPVRPLAPQAEPQPSGDDPTANRPDDDPAGATAYAALAEDPDRDATTGGPASDAPPATPRSEAAVEGGAHASRLDPVLDRRLEALRDPATRPHGFGVSPQNDPPAVKPEFAGPEVEADEAAACEFLWQRWSRRSTRLDGME